MKKQFFLLLVFCILFSLIISIVGQCDNNPISVPLIPSDNTIWRPPYTGPLRCEWILPSSSDDDPDTEDDTITLKFETFSLSGDDYIEIIDGEKGDHLILLHADAQPPVLTTSRAGARILFVSKNNTQGGDGFMLHFHRGQCPRHCSNKGYCWQDGCVCDGGYTGTDCTNTICENDCGGEDRGSCVQTSHGTERCVCDTGFYGGDCSNPFCDAVSIFTDVSGEFSDHIDSEENANTDMYLHNTNCTWIIQPPQGVHTSTPPQIVLDFSEFDTQDGVDVVSVFDGHDIDSAQDLGKFSGHSIPPQLIAHSGSMMIQFVTDFTVASKGFTAHWQATYKDEASTHHSDQSSHKDSNIFSSGAFIAVLVAFVTTLLLIVAFVGYRVWRHKKAQVENNDDDINYGPLSVDE